MAAIHEKKATKIQIKLPVQCVALNSHRFGGRLFVSNVLYNVSLHCVHALALTCVTLNWRNIWLVAFSFRFEYNSSGAAVCARLHKTEVDVTEILSFCLLKLNCMLGGGGGGGVEINLIPSKKFVKLHIMTECHSIRYFDFTVCVFFVQTLELGLCAVSFMWEISKMLSRRLTSQRMIIVEI